MDRGPAVFLRVAALGSASLDLCDRDAGHTAFVQHVLDLLQPFVTDDRDDHLHRAAPVQRHTGDTSLRWSGTVSWSGWGLTVGVSDERMTPATAPMTIPAHGST